MPSRIRDGIQDPVGPVSDLDGMRFLRICREPTTASNNQGTSNGTADPSARDLSRRFSDARPCPEDEVLIFQPWLLMPGEWHDTHAEASMMLPHLPLISLFKALETALIYLLHLKIESRWLSHRRFRLGQ